MRKIAVLAVFLIASIANAQMHGRAATPSPMPPSPDMMMTGPSAAAVTGTVSAVNGNTVSIASGLIAIDTTNAKIVNGPIVTGSLITAVLKSGSAAANVPLQAVVVAVTDLAQVTLTGSVNSVDTTHSSLVVLGKSIVVTPETSFVGPNVKSLADIQPAELAIVEANVSNGTLLATRIAVIAPMPQMGVTIHGTVKSIAADAWVISATAKDYTVVVNAQTKIIGNPQVGDTVDVSARIDSSSQYVALAIMKLPPPGTTTPTNIFAFVGTVQTLTATSLVITNDGGTQTTFVVNAHTHIAPGIGPGTKVIVIATKAADGTYTAIGVGPV